MVCDAMSSDDRYGECDSRRRLSPFVEFALSQQLRQHRKLPSQLISIQIFDMFVRTPSHAALAAGRGFKRNIRYRNCLESPSAHCPRGVRFFGTHPTQHIPAIALPWSERASRIGTQCYADRHVRPLRLLNRFRVEHRYFLAAAEGERVPSAAWPLPGVRLRSQP